MDRLPFIHTFDPIEVEWDEDHVFVTIEMSRSKSKEAQELVVDLAMAEDDDDLVKRYGAYFDHILKPLPESNKRTKLSVLIKKAWEADRITIEQIDAFMDRLKARRTGMRREAAQEAMDTRPI